MWTSYVQREEERERGREPDLKPFYCVNLPLCAVCRVMYVVCCVLCAVCRKCVLTYTGGTPLLPPPSSAPFFRPLLPSPSSVPFFRPLLPSPSSSGTPYDGRLPLGRLRLRQREVPARTGHRAVRRGTERTEHHYTILCRCEICEICDKYATNMYTEK